jgi:Ni/Fe-hydrogenase 1 B-type cytochrome subunit
MRPADDAAVRGDGPPGAAESSTRYRWVYLWHWPVRAMHWFAAAAVVTLVLTGFYIGKPYFFPSPGDASPHYMMGWIRFLHLSAAGVLVATAILRAYWLFVGDRYERWKALFPVSRRDWRDMGRMVKYYLMLGRDEEPHYLGHHPMQQLTYTGIYGVAAIMVVTGFALYGQATPGGFFFHGFGWVTALFGSLQAVRFVHHVLSWVFVIFVPVHVYLALRADLVEHTGSVSSIISGGRWVPDDVEYVDE